MIRKMARLTFQRIEKVKDEYNELVSQVVAEGTVEMAISLMTGTTIPANNVITQSSTHVGVSRNKQLLAGDKIVGNGETYTIDYATLDGRFAMYYLKKEA